MNDFTGKSFLADVRGGDYAHPGEEVAIDMALEGLPCIATQNVLDAGCGRGGTVNYLQRRGWGHVTGIDIEPGSIAYAAQSYPHSEFRVLDVLDVGTEAPLQFELIVMFTVLYAIERKLAALASLRAAAKRGGKLCLFEYVVPGVTRSWNHEILSLCPLARATLLEFLQVSGWRVEIERDLAGSFLAWYAQFLTRLDQPELRARYPADYLDAARSKYQMMHSAIKVGDLGAILVHATAQ